LAREILDTELTSAAAESYQRAYGAMVSVQMLSELEEVIQYKLKPEKRQIIHKVWWDRLQVIINNNHTKFDSFIILIWL